MMPSQQFDEVDNVVPASVLEQRRQERGWIALGWADEHFKQTAASFALSDVTVTDDADQQALVLVIDGLVKKTQMEKLVNKRPAKR